MKQAEEDEEKEEGGSPPPLPLETYPHEEDTAGAAEEVGKGEVSVKRSAEQLAAACWYLENSALVKSSELIIWRR